MTDHEQAVAFGKKIREKRQELRLTVEAAAKRIGVSKQYLSVLERAVPSLYTGKAITPKAETVEAIAKALEWNINEARLAAGYAPNMATHEVNGFRIDLPDDVYGFIPYNPEIIRTQEEADAFKESFLVTYEIIKRRVIEERRKKELE